MTHALIIGGGIAGPLTAMALQQVGITATVYEAYAESSALCVGAFLGVAVNGLDAMRSVGVHEDVKACGFPTETMEMWSGTGRRLGAVPIGGRLADGTVTHTMKRADLYRRIAELAEARGIRIEYGKRLASAAERDGTVIAVFADGTSARGDLLVGADGVHSAVRRIVDTNAPEPRYSGLGNIGGFVHADLDAPQRAYQMIFGKRAFFGYTVAPSGEVWWFANPPSSRALERDELASIDWRERLSELFADDAGPMVDLVRRTAGPLVATNQYDLGRVPRWRRGRMIVIGDAAHAVNPSSGQGVSMAAEDAVALAVHLHAHAEIEAGLAAFESSRRARVEKVVAFGQRYASTKAPGPIARVIRDLMLPLVFRVQARKSQLGWLFDHHIDGLATA